MKAVVSSQASPPTREAILACLRAADRPLTAAELAERLEVRDEASLIAMNRRLVAMERDGQLLPNRKGVLLLATRIDLVAGRIQGHRDGFGFLIPDVGGPDMFLSPREMQKAMHGDRVLVRRAGYDARGRPEGVIVEVTDRVHRRLVGRFINERGVHIVVPEDQRIKHDIIVPPGEVQGAQHGQVVTIEITDPPANGAPPIGRVVEVLGEIGDPGMEIEIAVRKFDVPHQFSSGAEYEASALPSKVRATDVRGRIDLRDIPLVTIDGEDARDFDDAVYCERHEDGSSFRLLVAIADVGHYVKPASALDRDALERSTSVYFPRRVIPMLPEKLSNGLCSLNPDVDRLVLVCDCLIDLEGTISAYQFYEGVMHSAARFTYDEVWALLSGSAAAQVGVAAQRVALLPRLQVLHELYTVLAAARARRGAIGLETVETRIVCDALGRIERIVPRHRNDAHRLIEECMLAANVCAANFMSHEDHAGLYRVHEGPTPEKLQRLREFLRSVGLALGGGEHPQPSHYAELAVQVQARPDSGLLQTMLLRSMQQAIYSPDNAGHFGLAYLAYAHFTSPIRRYPDLMTHRVIKALLRGERFRPDDPSAVLSEASSADGKPDAVASGAAVRSKGGRRKQRVSDSDLSELESTRESLTAWHGYGLMCSANERRADEASRDVEAWLKCQYMRERVGEQFYGRITGVAPFGVFVTLVDLFVEGLLHVSELGGEYFQYNESSHELRGERTGRRFRLTDELQVQVSRVDLEARRIEFRLVPRNAPREAGAANLESPEHAPATERKRNRTAVRKAAPAKTEAASRARAERLAARRRKPKPASKATTRRQKRK
ncbi:MAG: ribonuclease [Pseudomonadota bacterium]